MRVGGGKEMSLSEILALIDKLLKLEEKIENAIKKESDAAKRKKMANAYRKHNFATIRKLLFR